MNYVRAFIDFLIDNGASIDSFHVLGHSAGAQVVGVTGKSMAIELIPGITGYKRSSIPLK